MYIIVNDELIFSLAEVRCRKIGKDILNFKSYSSNQDWNIVFTDEKTRDKAFSNIIS